MLGKYKIFVFFYPVCMIKIAKKWNDKKQSTIIFYY